jgi:hypothetical protein
MAVSAFIKRTEQRALTSRNVLPLSYLLDEFEEFLLLLTAGNQCYPYSDNRLVSA